MSELGLLADFRMYARFALGLRRFLRRRMTPAQARAIVRRRLEARPERFLNIVRNGVFQNPRSPYRQLMRLADCRMGDLERMVRRHGVDHTLARLYEAGVYVTFEELKGRRPIVREGREFPVSTRDFDNPYLRHYYAGSTSGSTGAGTRALLDLGLIWGSLPVRLLAREGQGVLDAPVAMWRGTLPGVTGLLGVLRGPAMGNPPRRWFTPIAGDDVHLPLKHRLATEYILTVGRLCGVHTPRPELLRLDRPDALVRWAERAVGRHGKCLVRTYPSLALRVCVAAGRMGVDMDGVTFVGGGEPPTEAKVARIRRAGARWFPTFAATEVGTMGMGCAAPADGNDVHLATDLIALIQRPVSPPGWNTTVPAFFVTTLLPEAPKLLLNAGLDDYGVVEERSCGCPLHDVGYATHVRDIRSYSKLTGEGVTLVEADLVRIIEQELPERYGGTALDYQLMEEEATDGLTRLSLLVHPRVELPDDGALIEFVLRRLKEEGLTAAFAAAFWEQGRSLRVLRRPPVTGATGKLMPIHVTRKVEASTS
jgi:hypothetical protein